MTTNICSGFRFPPSPQQIVGLFRCCGISWRTRPTHRWPPPPSTLLRSIRYCMTCFWSRCRTHSRYVAMAPQAPPAAPTNCCIPANRSLSHQTHFPTLCLFSRAGHRAWPPFRCGRAISAQLCHTAAAAAPCQPTAAGGGWSGGDAVEAHRARGRPSETVGGGGGCAGGEHDRQDNQAPSHRCCLHPFFPRPFAAVPRAFRCLPSHEDLTVLQSQYGGPISLRSRGQSSVWTP